MKYYAGMNFKNAMSVKRIQKIVLASGNQKGYRHADRASVGSDLRRSAFAWLLRADCRGKAPFFDSILLSPGRDRRIFTVLVMCDVETLAYAEGSAGRVSDVTS